MNKRLALLISFALAAILTFGRLLYYVLKIKVTDLSPLAPYAEIVGTTVVLKRSAVIVRNVDAFVNEHPCLLIKIGQDLFEGTEAVDTLPIGWVELPGNGETVLFEYAWREQHISLHGEGEEYWTYPMALWQKNANAGKFYMKKTGLQ
ncbi:MAG: hypothetical protein RIE86_04555 [Imperialibacter sp.]|uniref:hypothetical protein n=1 Tax=Imperialibacter sp. TaxID=2038411 RepID=UPI0032EFAB76